MRLPAARPAGPPGQTPGSIVDARRAAWTGAIVAVGGAALPVNAYGAEGIIAVGITFALLLGAIPGVWAGARGYERERGNAWIAAVVAIVALAGLALYTFGGPPEELFTRLVILPFTLVAAIAASAVLLGAPMYAGYVLAYRVSRSLAGKGGNNGVP